MEPPNEPCFKHGEHRFFACGSHPPLDDHLSAIPPCGTGAPWMTVLTVKYTLYIYIYKDVYLINCEYGI